MIKWNQKALKELENNIGKALFKTGLYLEGKVKEEIKQKAYDTGDFLRSVNTRKVGKGQVRVGSNRIQAWIMEYGRKPGKYPNLDALVGWAGRYGFQKCGITKTYDELSSECKGKVYILARSIAKKGIKPRGIFRETLRKEAKNLQQKFRKYLANYLK